jgi:nitroreductase
MDALEALYTRRSIRAYRDESVPTDAIEKILRAGLQAPSGGNCQPWRFIVVTDPEKISRFDPQFHQPWVERAPAVIVVCACPMDSWKKYGADDDCYILDTAAAIENMVLAIHALGLGGVWILSFSKDAVRAILDIPNPWKIVSIIPFGYYDAQGTTEFRGRETPNARVRPRRPLSEVAFLNSADNPFPG